MRRHDTLLYPRIAWWYACGLWGLVVRMIRQSRVTAEERREEARMRCIRTWEGQ